MKRAIRKIWMLLLVPAAMQMQAKAQQSPSSDSLSNTLNRLAASTAPGDRALLKSKLYALVNTGEEKNWLLAMNTFYKIKEQVIYDSLVIAEKKKFPTGQLVRNEAVDTVYKEKDPVKKELLFKQWIIRFPPASDSDQIVYDYARNSVATAYAHADNLVKALEYANSIRTPVWRGEGWAGTARELQKQGHLKEAGELYRKAIENSYAFMTSRKSEYGAQFAATGYPSYCVSYAEILLEEKKEDSALLYVRLAHDAYKERRTNVDGLYAKILAGKGAYKEAFELLEGLVKEGKANSEVRDGLKAMYVKVKGSDAGYPQYMASLKDSLIANAHQEAAGKMMKKPGGVFVLKDLDGREVDLASLKGKVVVLDFWATWCGPCKRSFPAMQMAVNKYKSDEDVRFLFIDTWEHVDDPAPAIRTFIKDNHYSFQVLLDGKDPETHKNKVVEKYGVNGIPAKFILDRNGDIRFQITGFDGSDDAAVAEISAMIELARKG